MKLFVLAPFGVFPERSAGHAAVGAPLRILASLGHDVTVLSMGLRSFERRFPLSFEQEIQEGLRERRVVSAPRLLREWLTGRTRMPPVDASDFLERKARKEWTEPMRQADLCQVESPWAFPFVQRHFSGKIVFAAHNLELDLHEAGLRLHGGEKAVHAARQVEAKAWKEADLVLCVHEKEAQRFEHRYGETEAQLRFLPLGANLSRIRVASDGESASAKRSLGIPDGSTVVLFAGSAHRPNLEAAQRIRALARELHGTQLFFLLAGSVSPRRAPFPSGLATGPLASLDLAFQAADIAINPMESGSGMNVKVSEYLAWGLPVLSSEFGARGFKVGEEQGLLTVEEHDLAETLLDLAASRPRLRLLSENARRQAEAELSWERIAEARLRCYEDLLGNESPHHQE